MNNARNIEPDLRLKAAQLNIEMGDWVHSLAPWQVISHLTRVQRSLTGTPM
jgi:hypothetical protein